MAVSRLIARAIAALLFVTVPAGAACAAPDIVVGTHLDLSGPLSERGIAVRNGLVAAFDEINAAGGIGGRHLHLIAYDDGYNVRRAVAATHTLIGRDHVLAVLCPVGTPGVARTMPMVLNAGVLHLFPFASADETAAPGHPLAFEDSLPAARQIAVGLQALLAQRGALKVGVLYRDDRLGRAVLAGAADTMAQAGARLAGTAAFAPGARNDMAALAGLKAAGVELVVLGGVAPEAMTAMRQAAELSWFPVFLCGSACYLPEVPALGGRTVSGLYAVATTPIPYPDDGDARRRAWVGRYERRFGTVASADAFRAYLDARLFAAALRRAGPNPTPRHVARALEALSPWSDPAYGGVPLSFTAHDHAGAHTGFLAQIRNGRWTTLDPPARR